MAGPRFPEAEQNRPKLRVFGRSEIGRMKKDEDSKTEAENSSV